MKPSQRKPVFMAVPGRPGMKRFVGFEGDPGTVQVLRRPSPHMHGLGALGKADRGEQNFPTDLGTPGAMLYNESMTWGIDNNGAVVAPVDPAIGLPPVPGPQIFDPGISIPFGVSIIKWKNPTTMQSVPILASTPSATPVLSLNMERNSLLIQNNSTATTPDIPPNFYIGFNTTPQVGISLSIVPLSGILFDIITPRDSVFVLIAGGTGASQVVQGVVLQGTYAPL